MKIYLSRSNAADPAVYSIVKAELERLGHEIIQFEGGTYSDKAMLECEALVIVPGASMLPMIKRGESETSLTDDSPFVGRGQFGQVREFALAKADIDDVDEEEMSGICTDGKMMVIQEIDVRTDRIGGHNVYVSAITDLSKYPDGNWKTEYGFVTTDESCINISAIVGQEDPSPNNPGIPTPVSARPSHIKYNPSTFEEVPLLAAAKYLNLI